MIAREDDFPIEEAPRGLRPLPPGEEREGVPFPEAAGPFSEAPPGGPFSEAPPGPSGGSPPETSGEAASGPLLRLSPEELRRAIEAVLFAAGEPIPIRQLADLFEVSVHDAREAVEELRLEYVSSERAFRVEDIAAGVQVLTQARYEPWIRRHLSRARDSRLSPAAFETLAVIAYKQPINKADLESIRGVQCGPILKTLMDRNLVKVVGREETLGKPLLYGTTRRFLESFGLGSLAGLPEPESGAAPSPPAARAQKPPEDEPPNRLEEGEAPP